MSQKVRWGAIQEDTQHSLPVPPASQTLPTHVHTGTHTHTHEQIHKLLEANDVLTQDNSIECSPPL